MQNLPSPHPKIWNRVTPTTVLLARALKPRLQPARHATVMIMRVALLVASQQHPGPPRIVAESARKPRRTGGVSPQTPLFGYPTLSLALLSPVPDAVKS
jgi:hypothetical protein